MSRPSSARRRPCRCSARTQLRQRAIFHDGKWRIFYCMPDKAHREGVASADTVAGPFKTTFAYSWAKQIDPSIFRDDDGTLYYFWGQFSAKGAVTLGFHGRGGSFRGRNDANLFDVVSFQFCER